MKTTIQKEAILAAVCTMRSHPAADEIYIKLRADYPNISLGTVYRNLNTFARDGYIRKISIPNAGDRFDFRLDKHEHLLCDNCGRVVDVNADISISLLDNNVVLDNYTIIMHGKCKACAI